MNELDATKAKLKCLEMVEGTNLKWWELIRGKGTIFKLAPVFNAENDYYEFALTIFKGKPVFKGDILWNTVGNFKFIVSEIDTLGFWAEPNHPGMGSMGAVYDVASWNPPKPKTIKIEIPTELVEYFINSNLISTNALFDLKTLFERSLNKTNET